MTIFPHAEYYDDKYMFYANLFPYFAVVHEPATLLTEYFSREWMNLSKGLNRTQGGITENCTPAFFHTVMAMVRKYGSYIPISDDMKKHMPMFTHLLHKYAVWEDDTVAVTNIPMLCSIIVFWLATCKHKIITGKGPKEDLYRVGVWVEDTGEFFQLADSKVKAMKIPAWVDRIRELQ